VSERPSHPAAQRSRPQSSSSVGPVKSQVIDSRRAPTYQEILPLRTDNSDGSAILVDGVTPDHRATDVLQGSVAGG
jgi:hypothetical protein